MDSFRTVIVIPCYQEAARLAPGLFADYLRDHTDTGFVFVDDGSTDGSAALLDELAGRYPRSIAVLHNETNLGKGEAVRRGVLHALDRAEVLGYWDADLSTPLQAIDELRQALLDNGAHLVMGARVKITGHRIVRKPWRHYPGRVFATLASLVIGHAFYDTQCGAKLFTRDCAARCFARPFLSRWCFDIELLLRLLRSYGIDSVDGANAGLIEYPLREWIDDGDTRLTPWDVPRMAVDLGRIYVAYRLRGDPGGDITPA